MNRLSSDSPRYLTALLVTALVAVCSLVVFHWHSESEARRRALALLEENQALIQLPSAPTSGILANLRRRIGLGNDEIEAVTILPDSQRFERLLPLSSDARRIEEIGLFLSNQRTVPTTPTSTQDAIDQITSLIHFKELRRLNLTFVAANDPSIQILGANKHLEALDLTSTDISDQALQNAYQWTKLKSLNLNDTQITSKALEYIAKCPKLVSLDLTGTSVQDEGFRALGTLESLQYLRLKHTAISDAALKYLERLPLLTSLNLSDTQISEDGVKSLLKMKSLRFVNLSNTEIGDGAISDLIKMRGLNSLTIEDTRMSASARERLRSSLPNTDLTPTVDGSPIDERNLQLKLLIPQGQRGLPPPLEFRGIIPMGPKGQN